MSFECCRCGECCSHLGLVHKIIEDYGDYHFLVYNQYSGERTAVSVDPDKVSLFLDKSIFLQSPEACPFFRYGPVSAEKYCTIHMTRPEMCNDYGCWRLLILNSTGKRAGRIMGRRFLASEDEALTRLFEDNSNNLVEPDDAAWEENVILMLTRSGYKVRT